MHVSSPIPDQAGRPASQVVPRSFLAVLFGTGPGARHRRGSIGLPGHPDALVDPLAIAHPQGEAWAADLARGDQRKVGRGSPYAVNDDIEALYTLAHAAGGAIALDLGEEGHAPVRPGNTRRRVSRFSR